MPLFELVSYESILQVFSIFEPTCRTLKIEECVTAADVQNEYSEVGGETKGRWAGMIFWIEHRRVSRKSR